MTTPRHLPLCLGAVARSGRGDPLARNLITDTDRERVRGLHAEGTSRNDIARVLDRSPSTVTGIARALGLSFDRS